MSSSFARRNLPWITIAVVVMLFAVLLLFRPKPVSGIPGQPIRTSTSTPALIPSDAPLEGPFSSKATLVEFLDYQCPTCAVYHPIVKTLRQAYAGRLRFVVRQYPITELHQFAKGAAIAAVCSQRQGKFFEYSDVLFANREHLTRSDLEKYATDLGMDGVLFSTCLDDKTAEQTVIRDHEDGDSLGVTGTPTFLLNGKIINGLPTEDEFKALIDQAFAQ